MSDRNRLGEIRAKLSARTGALEILRVGPTVGHERFDEWQDKPHRLLYDAIDIGRATISDLSYLLSELATLRKDAAIGRAVRHSGVTLAWLIERGRELRNSRGSLSLSSGAYAAAHAQEIALVDAITSALREEER